jgi:hypothetical protein
MPCNMTLIELFLLLTWLDFRSFSEIMFFQKRIINYVDGAWNMVSKFYFVGTIISLYILILHHGLSHQIVKNK